ncbi:hypothetical protein NQ317_019460 [Molorchus minor]|uniref:Uncharacterized protein n=1 Tax=Molorchus minor TaxID=1323400 RepID=A0ABQ9IQR1_9CUCU|nr:hypothetical protein NQ317_019460 [Molorchus minor]
MVAPLAVKAGYPTGIHCDRSTDNNHFKYPSNTKYGTLNSLRYGSFPHIRRSYWDRWEIEPIYERGFQEIDHLDPNI